MSCIIYIHYKCPADKFCWFLFKVQIPGISWVLSEQCFLEYLKIYPSDLQLDVFRRLSMTLVYFSLKRALGIWLLLGRKTTYFSFSWLHTTSELHNCKDSALEMLNARPTFHPCEIPRCSIKLYFWLVSTSTGVSWPKIVSTSWSTVFKDGDLGFLPGLFMTLSLQALWINPSHSGCEVQL